VDEQIRFIFLLFKISFKFQEQIPRNFIGYVRSSFNRIKLNGN
jgi:hypothetical protein